MVTFETYYYIITSITTIVHYFQLQLLLITSITSITTPPNLEMEYIVEKKSISGCQER